MLCHVVLCHVISWYILSCNIYIYIYNCIIYTLLCQLASTPTFAIHVCHQQMALEQVHRSIRTSAFHWTIRGQYFVYISVPCSKNYVLRYIRIASTKSPSFSIMTFSVLLTNCGVLLPQSHDYSCYISRRILVRPPLWLHKHTGLGTTNPTLSTCDMSPVSVMLP